MVESKFYAVYFTIFTTVNIVLTRFIIQQKDRMNEKNTWHTDQKICFKLIDDMQKQKFCI